jgi:hypothetical protein
LVWKKPGNQIIEHEALTGLYVMFSMVGPRISAFKNTTRKLRTVTRAPLCQFTAVVDAADAAVQHKKQHKHSAPCKYTVTYCGCLLQIYGPEKRDKIRRWEMGAWLEMMELLLYLQGMILLPQL